MRAGLVLKVDDLNDQTIQPADVVSPSEIKKTITQSSSQVVAKNRRAMLCDPVTSGCTSPVILHFMGNQNTSAAVPAPTPTVPSKVVYLAQGGTGDGSLFLFSTPAGAETPLTQTNVLPGVGFGYGVTYDPVTNCAFIPGGTGSNAGVVAYHPDTVIGSGVPLSSAKCGSVTNGSVMGITSLVLNPTSTTTTPTTVVVYAQPTENRLTSFLSSQISGTATLNTTSPTCRSAWSLDARNVGSVSLLVAFCAETSDVEVYTIGMSGALTLKGSRHLTGLTAQSTLPANTGGWDVVLLDSGFAGILSRADHILVVVDAAGATVQEVSRISPSTTPALTGKLARMFRKSSSAVEVESGTDTGSSYDLYDLGATIVKTHLSFTASQLSSGPSTSSTGGTIYTCGGTTCAAANNQ